METSGRKGAGHRPAEGRAHDACRSGAVPVLSLLTRLAQAGSQTNGLGGDPCTSQVWAISVPVFPESFNYLEQLFENGKNDQL